MTTAVSLLLCAALFAAFGLVMRHARQKPGCDSCGSVCHRKESQHG
jgi:hypothetical protein